MRPAAELSLIASWSVFLWAKRFLWFVFKLLIGIGVGWGLLMSLDPFPMEIVSNWQEQIRSLSLDFPPWAYLAWVANNWLQITALIVVMVTVRTRRDLRTIGHTSNHAAFAASAISNYLEVEPMTTGLLRSQRKGEEGLRAFGALWREGFSNRIFAILTGVPFLPVDAIPARNGKVVKYREDIRKYLAMTTDESAQMVDQ